MDSTEFETAEVSCVVMRELTPTIRQSQALVYDGQKHESVK